jgi:tRNA(Arg) A34 adenosine deaminase TadA
MAAMFGHVIKTCRCTRRSVLGAAGLLLLAPRARAVAPEHQEFVDAAYRMRDEAVRAGDQAFGAVVVKDRRIIGFGPSRVVLRNDMTAHAEREAMREAQARLGTHDLSGAVLYSTSRPCMACEAAAAQARIVRMIYGRDAKDAGPPRRTES